MKKALALCVIMVFAFSVASFAATKKVVVKKSSAKVTAKVKPAAKAPVKPVAPKLPPAVIVPPPPPPPPPVKSSGTGVLVQLMGGYAAGGGSIGLALEKGINSSMSIVGEGTYIFGNQYNVQNGVIGGQFRINDSYYAGLNLGWSRYSEAVRLSVGGEITNRWGLSIGVVAGMHNLLNMKNLCGEVGYDTRLGLTAQAKYKIMDL